MATEAKTTNYWISSTALYIQLNAMGEPDYIQCSIVSGASILCYMQGIQGLGYDAGHNYQRWPLSAYPSIFPDNERKYVYVAIPRLPTTDNNQATVVFPSQKIDLYGKAIVEATQNEDGSTQETQGEQIGNEAYYYIFTGGIISAVKTDSDGKTRKREWEQHVDCGSLATDEALASGGEGGWWKYNSVTDSVTFLKTILKATFDTLSAKVADIKKLILGDHELTGVADNTTLETSNTTIVTPQYLGQFGVKHFLAKDKDDRAAGTITFDKIQKFLGGFTIGKKGEFKIDAAGAALLKSLVIDTILHSSDYDNAAQSGFGIVQKKNGKYRMDITDLMVWGKAIFQNLEIRNLYSVGGNVVLSPSASKILQVEEVKSSLTGELTGWKCYLLADDGTTATTNLWAEDDQVRCQTFNIAEGVYQNVSNKDYWRLVTKVSTANETITDKNGNVLYDGKKFAWIEIASGNCMEGSDVPEAGDTIVCMGNKRDEERQNLLVLETMGDDAPRIVCYRGVNSYSLKEHIIFEVGYKGVKVVTQFFQQISSSGEKVWTPVYMGDWQQGKAYEYYDQVSHHGTMWLCLVDADSTTNEEPTEDSAVWKPMTQIIPVEMIIQRDFDGYRAGTVGNIQCRVVRGSEDLTPYVTQWKVTRDSGNEQNDTAWLLKDKVKNFNGSLQLLCNAEEDDFGGEYKVVFYFEARGDDSQVLAKRALRFV